MNLSTNSLVPSGNSGSFFNTQTIPDQERQLLIECLSNFYQSKEPAKVSQVPSLVAKYGERLVDSLKKKYNASEVDFFFSKFVVYKNNSSTLQVNSQFNNMFQSAPTPSYTNQFPQVQEPQPTNYVSWGIVKPNYQENNFGNQQIQTNIFGQNGPPNNSLFNPKSNIFGNQLNNINTPSINIFSANQPANNAFSNQIGQTPSVFNSSAGNPAVTSNNFAAGKSDELSNQSTKPIEIKTVFSQNENNASLFSFQPSSNENKIGLFIPSQEKKLDIPKASESKENNEFASIESSTSKMGFLNTKETIPLPIDKSKEEKQSQKENPFTSKISLITPQIKTHSKIADKTTEVFTKEIVKTELKTSQLSAASSIKNMVTMKQTKEEKPQSSINETSNEMKNPFFTLKSPNKSDKSFDSNSNSFLDDEDIKKDFNGGKEEKINLFDFKESKDCLFTEKDSLFNEKEKPLTKKSDLFEKNDSKFTESKIKKEDENTVKKESVMKSVPIKKPRTLETLDDFDEVKPTKENEQKYVKIISEYLTDLVNMNNNKALNKENRALEYLEKSTSFNVRINSNNKREIDSCENIKRINILNSGNVIEDFNRAFNELNKSIQKEAQHETDRQEELNNFFSKVNFKDIFNKIGLIFENIIKLEYHLKRSNGFFRKVDVEDPMRNKQIENLRVKDTYKDIKQINKVICKMTLESKYDGCLFI